MNQSQLKKKVEEWRAKRVQKIAERLQLHTNQRREVSSMVLGLSTHTKIDLPTPRAHSRSAMDVRVESSRTTSARATIRRSSSCGDIQQLKVLQNKKCLSEKVQYTKNKPLQPLSVPRTDKKNQIKTPGLGTKESSSSKPRCSQLQTPKTLPKKQLTVVRKKFTVSCEPSNSGRKSTSVLSLPNNSEVVPDFQEKISSSSNLSVPVMDTLINTETEAELNSTFIIGNSNSNVLTTNSNPIGEVQLDSKQINKSVHVTFADICEIIEPNYALYEDSHDHGTEDIFVDAVSDVEVNCDPSYISAHSPSDSQGCFLSPSLPCSTQSEPLKSQGNKVNKENILPQSGGKVGKLDQPSLKSENAASLNDKTNDGISEKFGELFVTPSKELVVTPSKGPRKSRALVDSSNIISSTSIALVAREIKNKENPVDSKVILTPVRRSTRFKNDDIAALSTQKYSPLRLMNAQLEPNRYLKM